jgi:hypothetical protein
MLRLLRMDTLLILPALLLLAAAVDAVSQPPEQQQGAAPHPWQFLASYPRQYITYKLQPGEQIVVDGKLDDPAWAGVNWTEPMEDIAQSLYLGLVIPDNYATLMKVRYDEDFLYIGAKYFQSLTCAMHQAPLAPPEHLDRVSSAAWSGMRQILARSAFCMRTQYGCPLFRSNPCFKFSREWTLEWGA